MSLRPEPVLPVVHDRRALPLPGGLLGPASRLAPLAALADETELTVGIGWSGLIVTFVIYFNDERATPDQTRRRSAEANKSPGPLT
jgi:hypothetical protein